jgi:hypothetical protein
MSVAIAGVPTENGSVHLLNISPNLKYNTVQYNISLNLKYNTVQYNISLNLKYNTVQ